MLEKLHNFLLFFYRSQKLDGGGERVDINCLKKPDFNTFDIYQKTHWQRYLFCQELINPLEICGDFACGTGYGSAMMAQKAKSVIGVDVNLKVINAIGKRYKKQKNLFFIQKNLLDLDYQDYFDKIISFETLEHFEEQEILKLLRLFHLSLKKNGMLIFSTPYRQEPSPVALKMGFHKTFEIDETKINKWLQQTGFQLLYFKYQNYQSFDLFDELNHKDFIIGLASTI